MPVKRSLINKIREARGANQTDATIIQKIVESPNYRDVAAKIQSSLGQKHHATGTLTTSTNIVDDLLNLPGDQIEEDAGITPTATGPEIVTDARQTPGANRPNISYDPELAAAAKVGSREFASQAAGGLAGGLSLAALPPGVGAGFALPARAATYALVNRALGGDPSLMDVVTAGVGGVGDIMKDAGYAAKLVSKAPKLAAVESFIPAAAQSAADVGTQIAAEETGMTPRTSGASKVGLGLFSAISQKGGEMLTPSGTGMPPKVAAAIDSLRQQGIDLQGIPEDVLALTPYMSSDLLGAKTRITNRIGDIENVLSGARGKPYDPDMANAVVDTALMHLQGTGIKIDQARVNTLKAHLMSSAQTDPNTFADAVRNLIRAAPPTATTGEVAPLIGKIGIGRGLEPGASPEALGKTIQDTLVPRLQAQKEAAKTAYKDVYDPLVAETALVNPADAEQTLGAFKDQWGTLLTSARKFVNPALRNAGELAVQGVEEIPESKRIMLPGGVLAGTGQTPVEITIGDVAKGIKEINQELMDIPATLDNSSRRASLWNLRSRLNKLGDQTVSRLEAVNPLDPAIAKWKQYAGVRQQYGKAMEDLRMFENLPSHPTELGAALAKGRSQAKSNPVIEALDYFFGRKFTSKNGAPYRPGDDTTIFPGARVGDYYLEGNYAKTLEEVPLSKIAPLEDTDLEKVKRYTDQGKEYPPVMLTPNDDGTYEVWDGNHRVAAALARGEKSIKAWVERKPSDIDRIDIDAAAKEAAVFAATEKPAAINQFSVGDIEGLKTLPGITPTEAADIDTAAREISARRLPESPTALLNVLVPHGAEAAGRTAMVPLETTQRAWNALRGMKPEEADNIRNFAIRKVFDDAQVDGKFSLAKFDKILEANSETLPQDVLQSLTSIGSVLSGQNSILNIRPAELDRALKVLDAGGMRDFMNSWNREFVARPETARYLVQNLPPGTLGMFRESMVQHLFDSRAADPGERLLDIAQRMKEIPPQALETLLDKPSLQKLRDVETVIDHLAPVLNTIVSQRGGSRVQALGASERQLLSSAGYLKMGTTGTLGALAGASISGPVSAALTIPAAAVLFAAPKLSAYAILNPNSPLSKVFSNSAQTIMRGTTQGAKEAFRQPAPKEKVR